MPTGTMKYEEYKNLSDDQKDYYLFSSLQDIRKATAELPRKSDLKILWLSIIIIFLLGVISIFTDFSLPVVL